MSHQSFTLPPVLCHSPFIQPAQPTLLFRPIEKLAKGQQLQHGGTDIREDLFKGKNRNKTALNKSKKKTQHFKNVRGKRNVNAEEGKSHQLLFLAIFQL